MKLNYWYYFLLFHFLPIHLYGQTNNSPYSIIGIGDLYDNTTVRSFGMGDVGIASFNELMANSKNPALSAINSFTVYEFGILGKYNWIEQSQAQQKDFAVSPQYFFFSFPVNSFINVSAGITAFSRSNYKVSNEQHVSNTSHFSFNNFEGSGGLSQAYITSSFKINKYILVGLQANYIFGNYKNEITTLLNQSSNPYLSQKTEENSYHAWNFKPGVCLLLPLKNDKTVSLGVVYQFPIKLIGSYKANFYRTSINGTRLDNLKILNQDTYRNIPTIIQAGLAFQKQLHYSIGIDFDWYLWEKMEAKILEVQFKNSMRVKLGAEYTPDVNAVTSYFKRISYRIGISYQTYPYQIQGRDLNELKLHTGFSFPVKQMFSKITIGAAYAIRKPITSFKDAIQERYLQIILGITFNDRWFIKRKLF